MLRDKIAGNTDYRWPKLQRCLILTGPAQGHRLNALRALQCLDEFFSKR